MTDSIDLRIKQMSYSSSLTLHACPRKYQLYKLRGAEVDDDGFSADNVTFAFGHIVGEGIQEILKGSTIEQTIFTMFTSWHADLAAENEKQNKSFYTAVIAVQKFVAMRNAGLLEDYELMYFDGQPAIELSFAITTPDGFKFRGFVDAVLRHRITGEIVVLEIKTTSSANLNPAQYKNSSQALGYSVVLDVLVPELSSYKVIYMPYQTKSMEWTQMSFTKTYLQRAQWIQQLLLDIETIKLYETTGIYPMYGESCYNYFKECEFFGICTLNTESITNPISPEKVEQIASERFTVNLTLVDLIEGQLKKG